MFTTNSLEIKVTIYVIYEYWHIWGTGVYKTYTSHLCIRAYLCSLYHLSESILRIFFFFFFVV